MRPLRQLWYGFEYASVRLFLGLVSVAPLPIVELLANLAARISFCAWGRRRRIAIDNLLRAGICATEPEARRMALASFRTFTAMVAETVVARRRLTPENWKDHVHLRLSPQVEQLLRQPGQGLLVASAHIGNWEVAARVVSMFKPMCVIYRPFNNPYLDRLISAGRSGENLRLVSRFKENPMRFMRALAQGEIVALMIDQHVEDGGVPVEFFGRPAWTTKSVAMLHLISRVPLLVAFALRTGPLQYEVRALGPFSCQRTGDREKDAFDITQRLTREIETIARRYPEQYMWGHRRWKGTAIPGRPIA